MKNYIYTAKDQAGHTVKGEMESADRKHALDILRGKGLLVLKLEETRAKKQLFSFTKKSGKQKIKIDELVVFSRQMATMTGAGITIVNALDTLSDQVSNIGFKRILIDIRNLVNTGASFSDAMNRYVNIFTPYFVNMIRAGESSGTLDETLERVAEYMEKTAALQKKIKSAMIYPAVVTFMAIAITLVMILKVIPVFKDMYSGFGANLPGPTQFLISLSELLQKFFWLFIALFAALAIMGSRYFSTEKGKMILDDIKLKLPVFGPLLRKVAISKFTRTLSTLVKSGVPILSALEIVAKTAGNTVIEKAVSRVKDSVQEGESIAEPMEKSGIFPPLVTRMIAVGEKSGELETMLGKIADFYDEQVDTAVEGLTSMIEPLVIAFLGIVIGGIVICMFLPIFKMSTLIKF